MKTIPLAAFLVAGAALASADPSLTIYNQDFAVIRDTVPLDLKPGVNDVSFAGATARLEPDSVILRDPAGKIDLQILEQNYRNDPVSQELLLSLNEGKTIGFLVHQQNKPDEVVQAKIIRSGYVSPAALADEQQHGLASTPAGRPLVEISGGLLQFGLPGQPLFPSLGDDTVLEPTLQWKLQATAPAKLDAEMAYVTGGLSWQSAYNVIAAPDSDVLDIVGWITMTNQSGKTFRHAAIKLVAGDLNKIQPASPMFRAMGAVSMAQASAPQVTEKPFEDFHLYTLPSPTDLRDGETRQVEFVYAAAVQSQRVYLYDGAQVDLGQWRFNPAGLRENEDFGTQSTTKVAIVREFKNSAANHLGMPLPAGRIRFYKRDGASLEFAGENTIDHTPADETVKVHTGDAFDLVGERTRTDFKVDNANHRADESFAIKLSNHKKESAEIRVVEHLYRSANWEITQKSDAFEKTDAQKIEFRIALKPGEVKTVAYNVHYSW